MVAIFPHKVYHLNCGKSIGGDDVFGTFFDVLSLPRVLIVGDRTVRVQSHVVSQVLTIAHQELTTIAIVGGLVLSRRRVSIDHLPYRLIGPLALKHV